MQGAEKRKEFNDTLTELVEFATVSGNKITKEQVRLYFRDIVDDEEKYEFIYKYLTDLKIEIDGVKSVSEDREEAPEEQKEEKQVIGKVETDEAKVFFNMYMDDLNSLEQASDSDKSEIIRAVIDGDKNAVDLLTKLYLPNVIEIADEYLNSPLGRSDLVAEGNLALFEGSLEYTGTDNVAEFEKYIFDRIRKSMEKAVYEELGSSRTSDHLVQRINALNDASTEMAKELGREANLKELSEKLALSEDEIKELMKISIDALTVDESGQ